MVELGCRWPRSPRGASVVPRRSETLHACTDAHVLGSDLSEEHFFCWRRWKGDVMFLGLTRPSSCSSLVALSSPCEFVGRRALRLPGVRFASEVTGGRFKWSTVGSFEEVESLHSVMYEAEIACFLFPVVCLSHH